MRYHIIKKISREILSVDQIFCTEEEALNFMIDQADYLFKSHSFIEDNTFAYIEDYFGRVSSAIDLQTGEIFFGHKAVEFSQNHK